MNIDEFNKKCLYLYHKAQRENEDYIPVRDNYMWVIGHKIIRELENATKDSITFYRRAPNCIASIMGIPIKIIDYHNPEEIKLYKEIK